MKYIGFVVLASLCLCFPVEAEEFLLQKSSGGYLMRISSEKQGRSSSNSKYANSCVYDGMSKLTTPRSFHTD